MEVIQSGEDISIRNVTHFNINQTFDCGQCFRWRRDGSRYSGIVADRFLVLEQNNGEIILKNTSIHEFNEFWCDYFDLNTDYDAIGRKLIGIHPVLGDAYEYCSGIRILRQPPWEVLCSFIISQNNNIPRIKKIISSLCDLFGDKINNGFSFPSAERISRLSIEDLSLIRSGFRAKYILDAAFKVACNDIDFCHISRVSYSEAKRLLMKINGVGPKVADCVLLYGFHRLEAFPMDIWMKKVMEKFFVGESSEIFGEYAGVAQQYLYHYSRMNSKILA